MDEQNINQEEQPVLPPTEDVTDAPEMEFRPNPEALAAAADAIEYIQGRSFSGRHPELGKMVNCPVCRRRHRQNDPLLGGPCTQVFKQLWIDEDLDTGELTIQYATVPLPGQKPTPKSVMGAAFFAKKRRNRRPNHIGLQIVELTRQLLKYVNKENFTSPESQMIEARRFAVNTLRNKREREAKRIRRQQRASRRINRTR